MTFIPIKLRQFRRCRCNDYWPHGNSGCVDFFAYSPLKTVPPKASPGFGKKPGSLTPIVSPPLPGGGGTKSVDF